MFVVLKVCQALLEDPAKTTKRPNLVELLVFKCPLLQANFCLEKQRLTGALEADLRPCLRLTV